MFKTFCWVKGARHKKIDTVSVQFSSFQFSRSVVSNSFQLHELQHTRPSCPLPTPRVYPNPCPSSWWYHPTISSCHPLLLLPSIFPSIRVFSNESALRIRWPKYWSFSFNISPSSEHPGLISFRMDWLDLLIPFTWSSRTGKTLVRTEIFEKGVLNRKSTTEPSGMIEMARVDLGGGCMDVKFIELYA